MVWGCMGWESVGKLAEIEGRMDANQYVDILKDNLLPSLEESGVPLEDVIFQQDNDPKHTSKKAMLCRLLNQISSSVHSSVVRGHIEILRALEG